MEQQSTTSVTEESLTLDIRGVGHHFGLKCPKTVRKYWKEGLLPPPDFLLRGRPRWKRETISAFLAAQSPSSGESTGDDPGSIAKGAGNAS